MLEHRRFGTPSFWDTVKCIVFRYVMIMHFDFFLVFFTGLFSRGAIDRIIKSPIKEVVVTNTIRIPENLYCEKLKVISVSLLLAEAIRRIHYKQPLSDLHRDLHFDDTIVRKGSQ